MTYVGSYAMTWQPYFVAIASSKDQATRTPILHTTIFQYFYNNNFYLVIYSHKSKKLRFIQTVNGDESKTANIIRKQC